MDPFIYLISGCSSGSTSAYTSSMTIELTVGEVYALIFAGDFPNPGCYTVISEHTGESGILPSVYETASLQTSCETCLGFTESPQYSGSYEYEWCDSCDGVSKTGTTVPHPIAISQDGLTEIIQLTSVTIGGPNGLNY